MRIAIVVISALLLAPAALAERAHVGYPNSIAALGDSDSTGFDSQTPGRDTLDNSWSNGGNPAVQSHYRRILAANPRIKGHNANYARDGAKLDDLLRQATIAANSHSEYITIEMGGNDTCTGPTGASDTPLPRFRAELAAALRMIGRGSPNARVLVTSLPFANPHYDEVFGPILVSRGYTSDGSFCDPMFNAAGVPDPAKEAKILAYVRSYEDALAQVCATFVHCRHDGGAMAAITPVVSDLSFLNENDPYAYTHPSVQGLAKMAAASWAATFDFTDASAPVSHASRSGRTITLTATDNAGVSGLEYRLAATGPWTRYTKPVTIAKGKTLTWRAVDVSGNCEATHSLKA